MSRTPSPPPYGTIVFDCDSTLSAIEGIEELAHGRTAELRQQIAALTDRAMDGELPLEDVYGARLDLLQPTRADVERIGALYVERALPNAKAVVAALQFLGKRVAILSGGLLPPVLHIARHLGVDEDDVNAVDLTFDDQGRYASFDTDSPLARAGGKPEVLAAWSTRLPQPLCLIGDGATDLEAASVCARFVAFTAIARREAVVAGADVECDTADLAALLPALLTPEELFRLAGSPAHADVVRDLPTA